MGIDESIGLPGSAYGVAGHPKQAFGSFSGDGQETVIAGVPDKRLAVWSLTVTPKSGDARTFTFTGGACDTVFTACVGGTATATATQHRSRLPDVPLFVVSAGQALMVQSDLVTDSYIAVSYTVTP